MDEAVKRLAAYAEKYGPGALTREEVGLLLAHLSRQEAEIAEMADRWARAGRAAKAHMDGRRADQARAQAAEAARSSQSAAVSGLVEALKWYADPISYMITQMREPRSAAHGDNGRRARAALTELEKHTSDVGRPMPVACGANAPSAASLSTPDPSSGAPHD